MDEIIEESNEIVLIFTIEVLLFVFFCRPIRSLLIGHSIKEILGEFSNGDPDQKSFQSLNKKLIMQIIV